MTGGQKTPLASSHHHVTPQANHTQPAGGRGGDRRAENATDVQPPSRHPPSKSHAADRRPGRERRAENATDVQPPSRHTPSRSHAAGPRPGGDRRAENATGVQPPSRHKPRKGTGSGERRINELGTSTRSAGYSRGPGGGEKTRSKRDAKTGQRAQDGRAAEREGSVDEGHSNGENPSRQTVEAGTASTTRSVTIGKDRARPAGKKQEAPAEKRATPANEITQIRPKAGGRKASRKRQRRAASITSQASKGTKSGQRRISEPGTSTRATGESRGASGGEKTPRAGAEERVDNNAKVGGA